MKTYNKILLLIFQYFIVLQIGFSQSAIAKKQIKELKNGYLLIRLSTREKTVDDLKKMGKLRAADEIRKEQEEKNKKIVEAVKKNFTFCEYRFFYSQYSAEILQRNFKFYVFDKDLKPDTDFNLNGKEFYVAEFVVLQGDTARIGGNNSIEYTDDFSAKEKTVYYQNMPNRILAFVIKDNHFVQLKYPFPYYVGGNVIERAIRRMNSKLGSYYKHLK